jgi:hypothetical protein
VRLPRTQTLVIILLVLGGAWLWMHAQRGGTGSLPWNRGQAGSIFQGGHMGGGQ